MTTAEKVARVAEARIEFGLTPALAALRLPRSTWYYHRRNGQGYADRYRAWRAPLEQIAREHPAYGYRRTTVELQQVYDWPVNHKVVQRLLKLWELPLIRSTRRPKPGGIRQALAVAGERANLVAGLETIGAGEVAYTDFTELVYADGARKAQLLPLLDHTSKMVWGWAVGERATTDLALKAWQAARQQLRVWRLPIRRMIVHHDQDPVFTGYGWTGQLLLRDGVRLSYALHGPRDNPEMEAFFSRFKQENRSLLLDARTPGELCDVVAERIRYYNTCRRHSQTDYLAPEIYLKRLLSQCRTPQFRA